MIPIGRKWWSGLKADPVAALSSTGDDIIIYFTCRDLLGEKVKAIESIWSFLPPQNLLKGQLQDGSWASSGLPIAIGFFVERCGSELRGGVVYTATSGGRVLENGEPGDWGSQSRGLLSLGRRLVYIGCLPVFKRLKQ
jgi:hypothetical protein